MKQYKAGDDLSRFDGHWPGPWNRYGSDLIMATGTKGELFIAAEVRGWGYLTGKGAGALGLSDDDAIRIQDINADLLESAPVLLEEVKMLRAKLAGLEDDGK